MRKEARNLEKKSRKEKRKRKEGSQQHLSRVSRYYRYRIYATSETTWEVNLEDRHRGEALKTHPASQHGGRLRDSETLSVPPRVQLRDACLTPQRVPVVPPLDLPSVGKNVPG